LCGDEVDLVFDNLLAFDHAVSRAAGPIFPVMPTALTVPLMAAECAPGTTFSYGYLKPLIRKSFLEATGVRYPEIRISEDLLFYLELLIHHPKTKLTDEAGYVYTTPIGPLSRRRSNASTSVPDNLQVANMLDDLVVRYSHSLTSADVEAIRRRSDALRESEPLIRLYESWSRGQYLRFAAQFLSDPQARRALIAKLRR
jgi:succinoglycan biosynthesis protein ExoO